MSVENIGGQKSGNQPSIIRLAGNFKSFRRVLWDLYQDYRGLGSAGGEKYS